MQLRYPSLFPRMALHIGAALLAFVLIGAASLALIAARELRGYVETRQSTLGQEAAAVLADGGESALRRWLREEADIPGDVSVYILDADSHDILDRELPGQYAEFVRTSVVGQPESPNSSFRPIRLAPQLVAADGTTYAFLVLPKGISLWGSPAITAGLLLVALTVIASVAWLIARTFSRPINQLQLAVRELASGNTEARAPPGIAERDDELGSLAADFNSMAEQLTTLMRGREDLLREMSHELRSPLARLQAAVALANEHQGLEVGARERIDQEISRMNRVIGEILRYSSLDASVQPSRRLVRIDRLLRELVEVEEIEATNRGCRLELLAEPGLAVVGDPELLNSCFENVLRNAIRYAPAGTAVTIEAHRTRAEGADRTRDSIEVSISDYGPGVAAEHLERIFEPYFRVGSGNHDSESTGLGLAIVRRIATHHAGRVRASARAGGGLTVTVTLPAVELQ